jgi:hypothetical protein
MPWGGGGSVAPAVIYIDPFLDGALDVVQVTAEGIPRRQDNLSKLVLTIR